MSDHGLIISLIYELNTNFKWPKVDDKIVTIPVRKYRGLDLNNYSTRPSWSGREYFKYSFLIDISRLNTIRDSLKDIKDPPKEHRPVVLFNKLDLDRYLLMVFLYKGFIENTLFDHFEKFLAKSYKSILDDFYFFYYENSFKDIFPFDLPSELDKIPTLVDPTDTYKVKINFKDFSTISKLEKKNKLVVITSSEWSELIESLPIVSYRCALYFLILRSCEDFLNKGTKH